MNHLSIALRCAVLAAVLSPGAAALAQGSPGEPRPASGARDERAPAVREGMTLAEALAAVGRAPDSSDHIGAACGVLDVTRWEEEGIKVISNNGVVVSIAADRAP